MAADGRFGGHIVSGHIDGTGQIESMRREENAVWVTIACADKILDLIVEKGSICIDGISLTVAAVTKRNFSVSVIPHTGEETTLLKKKSRRSGQSGKRHCGEIYSEICGYRKKFRCGQGKNA